MPVQTNNSASPSLGPCTKTHRIKNIDGDKTVDKYRTTGSHIIWNREVTLLEKKSIQSFLYMHLKQNWNTIEQLDVWLHMQNIKQTDTLRIGFKSKKKPPKVVNEYGNQD